jgi:tRNA(Ile)-lysidine synthase
LSPAVTAIRPLLEARRADVLAYLAQRGQKFCVDPTNTSLDFTRNRLRHELLPQLREQFHFDIDHSLLRLANIANDAQQLIERLAEELLDRCLLPNESTADKAIRLDTRALANQDRHLVREMFVTLWRRQNWPLQGMGFEQWELLAELANCSDLAGKAATHTTNMPGNMIVGRCANRSLAITPQQVR